MTEVCPIQFRICRTFFAVCGGRLQRAHDGQRRRGAVAAANPGASESDASFGGFSGKAATSATCGTNSRSAYNGLALGCEDRPPMVLRPCPSGHRHDDQPRHLKNRPKPKRRRPLVQPARITSLCTRLRCSPNTLGMSAGTSLSAAWFATAERRSRGVLLAWYASVACTHARGLRFFTYRISPASVAKQALNTRRQMPGGFWPFSYTPYFLPLFFAAFCRADRSPVFADARHFRVTFSFSLVVVFRRFVLPVWGQSRPGRVISPPQTPMPDPACSETH